MATKEKTLKSAAKTQVEEQTIATKVVDRSRTPKWFTGKLYKQGGEVCNPIKNITIGLTRAQLTMYDFIISCANARSYGEDYQKAVRWFRDNHPEEFNSLLQ